MKKTMRLFLSIATLCLGFGEQIMKAADPNQTNTAPTTNPATTATARTTTPPPAVDDDSDSDGEQPNSALPKKPGANYFSYFGFKAADTVNNTFWNVFTQAAVKTGLAALGAKYEWGKTKHMKELEEIDKKTRQYTEQQARAKAKVAKYQADGLIDQQELEKLGKKAKRHEASYQEYINKKAQLELQFAQFSNAISAADKQVGVVEDLKKEELDILKPLKKGSEEYTKQEQHYANEIAKATTVALQLRKDSNSAVDLFQHEQRETLTRALVKRNQKMQKSTEDKTQLVELKKLQKQLDAIDVSHRSSEKIVKQLKEQRNKKLKHLQKESAEYAAICEEYTPKIKKKKEELHALGEKRIECLEAINKCEVAIALKEPMETQPQPAALAFGNDGHLIVSAKAA